MRRAAWMAVLAVAGCQRVMSVDATEEATVLVGVAVSFADSAFVTLGRSLPGAPTRPAPGARLELSVDGTVVRLEQGPAGGCGLPAGFTCYRGRLDGLLEPGDTVRLAGRLPSGAPVRGEAVAPRVPDIRLDGAGSGDTLRYLRLSDEGPAPEVLGLETVEGRVGAADTVVSATVWTPGGRRRCPVRLPGPPPGFDLRSPSRVRLDAGPPGCEGAPDLAWDSMAVPVTLLHYDRNFTLWTRSGVLVEGDGGYGVEGVSGVLGAATPRTFVLVVRP